VLAKTSKLLGSRRVQFRAAHAHLKHRASRPRRTGRALAHVPSVQDLAAQAHRADRGVALGLAARAQVAALARRTGPRVAHGRVDHDRVAALARRTGPRVASDLAAPGLVDRDLVGRAEVVMVRDLVVARRGPRPEHANPSPARSTSLLKTRRWWLIL
jgi:hypothetical protein